jgi:hypothetical protein
MADLTAVRGDTNEYDVTVTRDGSALDLTGATLKFTAKRSMDDSDLQAVFQKTIGSGIVVTDEPGGLATLTVDPADTSSLPAPRSFHYDLELTESDGRVTTVAIGQLRLSADVERS